MMVMPSAMESMRRMQRRCDAISLGRPVCRRTLQQARGLGLPQRPHRRRAAWRRIAHMGSAGTADACAAAGARVTSTRVHSARLKASLLDMASDTPLSADARAAAVFALQGFALDRDEYALFKQLAAETRLAASEPDHDHRRR